jgi:hypothetical protein
MKKLLSVGLLILGSITSNALADTTYVKTIGNFGIFKGIDALSDEDSSFIVTTSKEDENFMVWRCKGETLELYISQPKNLFDTSKKYSVLMRFDDLRAFDMEFWRPSTNGKSLFTDPNIVYDITDSAIRSRQITMRNIDMLGNISTLVFDLDGLKDSLKEIKCYEGFFDT